MSERGGIVGNLRSYPSKVRGLPANPKYVELPCGCRVLENADVYHTVRNEQLNILLAQCLECGKVIDIRPAEALDVQ
jgi:uncharacterized protein (UPF0305 family)